MNVFVDMDGVVADFVAGAMRLHDRVSPFDDVRGDAAWGIDRLWGIEPAEFWREMGYDFWAGLPLMPGADDIVGLLADNFGAANLCFLTSPCLTEGCVEGKIAWARKYYRMIPMLFSVSSSRQNSVTPKWFCANEDSLLVDDYSVNADRFREAGGNAILVPRLWNRREDIADDGQAILNKIASEIFIIKEGEKENHGSAITGS